MISVTIAGGDSTTTSRTATLLFATKTTISSIKIPVVLADSTRTKKAVVTTTIDGIAYAETFDFDGTETGAREIEIALGYEAQGTVTVKFAGTRSTINYGTYTYPVVCFGGMLVSSNAYNFTVNYDAEDVWNITSENDGYPFTISYPPDTSIFTGYDPPKPLNSWKIDANNDGYPWTWGFTEVVAGEANIFLKTESGLIPLTAYYKNDNGLIPLIFIKQV